MTTILIVEDDPAMTVALRDGFEFEKYTVDMANDGDQGQRMASRGRYDVIILDVMLPKKSGLDVCRELRKSGNNTPIIMLTARGQEIDKVLGLKLGADDYITKPFSFMELLARAEAVLRRAPSPAPTAAPFQFGDVTVDFKRHEARKAGQPIELSPREFQLLAFFIEHRGEIVTRETLLDAVWGGSSLPFTRTVDMHIAKLRKKIEDNPGDPKFLVTLHRLGYKFTG